MLHDTDFEEFDRVESHPAATADSGIADRASSLRPSRPTQ